jgi:phosphate transport system substrate-binding protein
MAVMFVCHQRNVVILKHLRLRGIRTMAFSVSSLRRAATTTVFTTAIAISPLFAPIAQAGSISGAGATFPEPLYNEYIKAYQSKNPGEKVSYQGIGSGGGIRQVQAGAVDFGGSDAAMTDAQIDTGKAKERGILLIPTAGGAVVPVINLPGVKELKLSRAALAGIFSGKVTTWNDAKIAADNAGVSLPGEKIRAVVRADGSGTTFIFTNHLSAVDAYFKGRVGAATAPQWTNDPLKGRGNAGVASTVQKTKNSIGYVEWAFAKQAGLTIVSVQDKNGQYVQPSLDGINKALASITFPENFRVFNGNPDGYPITGVTWMILYKQYPDAAKAASVKNWAKWVLSEGQSINNSKDYAQIGSKDTQRAIQQVELIK